jgi:hypothetical protein
MDEPPNRPNVILDASQETRRLSVLFKLSMSLRERLSLPTAPWR